jgi:hypothetical protein
MDVLSARVRGFQGIFIKPESPQLCAYAWREASFT